MSQSPIDQAQIMQKKKLAATQQLINQKKGSRAHSQDRLSETMKKRSVDSVKFTHLMLKTRLNKDLDETLASHFERYPEMRDNFFVGIITDENFGVEVISREEAIAHIVDATEEEARESLANNPFRFFERKNFTMKTPENEAYSQLKKQLEDYFNRNGEIIEYLRSTPEANVSPTDLYQSSD